MNRALIVGIDNYPIIGLKGCVNSAKDLYSFLIKYCNFNSKDITLLFDDKATKQAILSNIELLIKGIASNDRILLYFSGHGDQLLYLNSDNSVSSLREVICPFEFYWTEQTAISDIELYEILSQLPKENNFLWISDSCNSGGLFDLISKNKSKKLLLQTAIDIQAKTIEAQKSGMLLQSFDNFSKELNLIFLAACESYQKSFTDKFGDRYESVFTKILLQEIMSPNGLSLTLKEIMETVRININQMGYKQDPIIRGLNLFGNSTFLNIKPLSA